MKLNCKPLQLAHWILDGLRRNAFDVTPTNVSTHVYLSDEAEEQVIQIITRVIVEHLLYTE